MKSQYTDEEIRQGALMDKAVDWVYDHAKVNFSYKISKQYLTTKKAMI